MIHKEASPLAGTTVKIREGVTDPAQGAVVGGAEYRVEDWWDRVGSQPWGMSQGNPACLHYAMRITKQDPAIPPDDEVLYGKIGYFGGRRGRHARPGLGRKGKGPGRHKGGAGTPGQFLRWLMGRRGR